MPPKNKKKTKSKRYSCDLCVEIDNARMILCDDCGAKYHLDCLGNDVLDVNDQWICFECLKNDLSRSQRSITNVKSTNLQPKQAMPATPQANNSNSKGNQTDAEHQNKAERQRDGHKAQSGANNYTELQSPSSAGALKEQTDAHRAQSIVHASKSNKQPPNVSKGTVGNAEAGLQVNGHNMNVTEDPSEEIRNRTRSQHSSKNSQSTRSSVNRRRQIELDRIEEEKQLREQRDREYLDSKYRVLLENCSDKSDRTVSDKRSTDRSSYTEEWIKRQGAGGQTSSDQIVELMDKRIPLGERTEFARKLKEITFEDTSPLGREELMSLVPRPSNSEEYPSESQRASVPSECLLAQSQSAANRKRVPCQKHDAKLFMFQDRHDGMPVTNSTFKLQQPANDQVPGYQGNQFSRQNSLESLGHCTLEWDNYLGRRSNTESDVRHQTDQAPVGSSEGKRSVAFDSRSKIESQRPDPKRTEMESNWDSSGQRGGVKKKCPPNITITVPDTNGRQSFDDQSTLGRRSSKIQSNRRVGFEDSRYNHPTSLPNMRNQPGMNVTSASLMNRSITHDQIAARHVIDKKLPIFSGDANEWPIWIHKYKNSTELCGFSNGENLDRLEKCLRDPARSAVQGHLINPDAVPFIIDTLELLYGRPEVIIRSIVYKIRDHPPLKQDKLDELMDFAFEVQTICTTIESLDCFDHLTDPMLIEELVDKLPTQEKKDWAKYKVGLPNVTLKTLAIWLYEMAKILSTIANPRTKKANGHKPEKERHDKNQKAAGLERVNVHVNQTGNDVNAQYEKNQKGKFSCPICNNDCKNVGSCSKFKSIGVDARWKGVFEFKLCRHCLRKHNGPCRSIAICGKNGCQYKHHSLLHNDSRHSSPSNKSATATTTAPANFHSIAHVSTLLRIVPVILHNGKKSINTFAFLDEGTTVTMMEKRLADELGLSGSSEQICLIWTKKIHRRERAERVSLQISGIGNFGERYDIKGVRTVDDLHLPTQTINKNELIANYPYLKDVPFIDYNNATPGIMIGSDMPKFGAQLQVVESKDVKNNEFNGPMASKTRLGWSVHGPRNMPSINEFVNVHQFEICPHHNELDNEIHQRVKEYFSIENFGVRANNKIQLESKDEERALEMLNRLTTKVNGKYETGLLWRSDSIALPDSYQMALKRLISLERQGPEMIRIMAAKVADYVSKGYARKLSKEELKYNGPVWYLPLFGVVNPKKPGKIRMVFDAAAKVKSVSLNSALLKGPDLYTSLIDILRRFRERLFTGGGDIFEMYHQILIIEKDRHFQRFLFREDNSKEPDVYQMDAMTFGANCSPCTAQFVKNENANEFAMSHPRAVSAIVDNHYVDDMMESEHTEQEMVTLMRDVTTIHAEGGFTIRNFISNSENVLNALGTNRSNETIKDITPKSELKVERVLGMWYDTKNDVFTFSLRYTPISEDIFNGCKLPTKREILRILMSIFDPLGLLSNFLVYLKILLQEVWRNKMDWDERLSSTNLIERWKRWLAVLPDVESVKVPRLYSSKMSPRQPKSIEMHIFVDASEDAFAAVAYFRIEDEDGVDCSLVGSKARVAPLKYLSIPRKELQASVLGTRLSESIKTAQRFTIDRRIIWSDSATVISWLNSDHRKYSQFVAHRVGEILESSDVNEWRWIPTKENVADEATKWNKSPNFEPTNRWFKGPDFLRLSENQWPERKKIANDVEEEMKANFVHSSFCVPQIIDPERFSKFKRMVRSLAYAIRFRNVFNGKAKKGAPLNQDELRRAESLIFRQAQFEGYPAEMVILERNETLPRDKQRFIEKPSPLYDGTPYLDAEGVLRMKSRIDGARDLSIDTKRPIVLPKDSRITKLLLLDYHSKFFHQNHESVVNEVRQKFYVPSLRVVLKKTRKSCQWCKIKKAHPIPPQMADLPAARLATRFVPFSFVGIDFFGPMFVTIGRRTEKRWGVLFTCLTIRAIHIEIASGLDTNSCILCIQNFIADHGPVIEFHSDCGTNFKGSDNVLQQEISKIDPKRLETEFTTTYTKWIFNPPASPHMGGSWERLIRSVKTGIDEILLERTPREDVLRNLLKQIQNVVNSRPLTFIPLDVEEDEALTPNHFLKLSSNGVKPPCEIELDGPYLRESWKESQRLTEMFWKRFIREYLPTIARRSKWHKPVAPLKPGDLVLVVDENSPRNTYPKAKVVRTQVGSNGQVRRAKVEFILSTNSNAKGQITKVTKNELWRSAHKLALLDVAIEDGLAQPDSDRETGGSVSATDSKPKERAENLLTDSTDATGSLDRPPTSSRKCQI